jgi:hypothetical protein
MSFSYTSRDAYNGCLSLFSQSEAEHRGGGVSNLLFNKMKISGDISKTSTGYEFNINRITAVQSNNCHKPNKLPLLLDDSMELNDGSGGDYTDTDTDYSNGISDYIIPTTAFAKIILTTDTTLFPSQQRNSYKVSLQLSNFDFSDLAAWPALSMISTQSTLFSHTVPTIGDSCSVSIGM